jgi:replication-associated recombination protein RarA
MASEKSDDQKYQALMAKYKELRGSQGEGAVKYLKAAMKLRENGNVSDDVVLGMAYL